MEEEEKNLTGSYKMEDDGDPDGLSYSTYGRSHDVQEEEGIRKMKKPFISILNVCMDYYMEDPTVGVVFCVVLSFLI